MDFKTLLKLKAANSRIPHNAYFAYQGVEIYDFKAKPRPGIELKDGRWVSLVDAVNRDVKFYFD